MFGRGGRSILLHVRCAHCLKLYQQMVDVPVGDDVPTDGDELIESAFIREMRFSCPKDESTFAEIVAFKIIEAGEDAAAEAPDPQAVAA